MHTLQNWKDMPMVTQIGITTFLTRKKIPSMIKENFAMFSSCDNPKKTIVLDKIFQTSTLHEQLDTFYFNDFDSLTNAVNLNVFI